MKSFFAMILAWFLGLFGFGAKTEIQQQPSPIPNNPPFQDDILEEDTLKPGDNLTVNCSNPEADITAKIITINGDKLTIECEINAPGTSTLIIFDGVEYYSVTVPSTGILTQRLKINSTENLTVDMF